MTTPAGLSTLVLILECKSITKGQYLFFVQYLVQLNIPLWGPDAPREAVWSVSRTVNTIGQCVGGAHRDSASGQRVGTVCRASGSGQRVGAVGRGNASGQTAGRILEGFPSLVSSVQFMFFSRLLHPLRLRLFHRCEAQFSITLLHNTLFWDPRYTHVAIR